MKKEKIIFPLLHPNSRIFEYWTPIFNILVIYTLTIMPFLKIFVINQTKE